MSTEKPRDLTRAVKQYVDRDALKKDVSFSMADISSAMMDQAALFAHYGVEAAKASRQVDDLKLMLENTESRVHRELRDAAAEKGEKVSEALLDRMIARDSRVINAKRALNEAKQIENVAKIAVESFRHRRDMLVQQGLIQREEMKGEVAVIARKTREESLEAQRDRILELRKK